MAAKKKSNGAEKTSTRINKSAWIRSQPVSLSAKDVVDKAAKEAITLSLAQVYTARSTAKRQPAAAKAIPTAETKRGPGRPKGSGKVAVSGDLRREFIALAVRLGTDEAKRLLDRMANIQAGS